MSTQGRRIYGILAPPRVSRNNNLYLPEELARAHGLVVPLYLDHEDFEMGQDGRPTGRILPTQARGRLTLLWNKVMQRLEYAGEVWDRALQRLISSGQRPHVSLAAEPRQFDSFRGHNVPIDMQFFSVAAVREPGMPESTITMEQRLGACLESWAPAILEPESRTMVLEFDTASLTLEDDADLPQQLAEDSYVAAKVIRAVSAKRQAEGFSRGTTPVAEPLHPDFQKMRSAMKDRYGDEKGDSVFWATVNKKGQDETKPMSKELLEEMGAMLNNPSLIPQGYQNLTPMRANVNQRSGLTGVTGVSQGVPMRGTGQNDTRGVTDQAPRPVVSVTGQDQQIVPRNLQPRGSLDGAAATGTGVSRDGAPSGANKAPPPRPGSLPEFVQEDDGRGNVSKALPKKFGAPTDREPDGPQAEPHGAATRSIGMAQTPYESRTDPVGTPSDNGNSMPSKGPNPNVSTFRKEEEEEEAGKAKADEEEEVKEGQAYGFSKEELLAFKSSYTREEWPRAWRTAKSFVAHNPRLREAVIRNRIEMSGVNREAAPRERESRVGGPDVVSSIASSKYGVDMSLPTLEQHVAYLRGERGPVAPMRVPFFFPPPIKRATGLNGRLEFIDEIANWTDNKQRLVSEAIATTTSGAAMAVDGGIPALIVPTQLSGMLRDTVYFQQIQQGSNTARFQTITVPTAGALTQNTEPSQASQTLATVDIAPTPRGVEQQISFEAERKILGPILEGVILSFRVSELYDEDFLLLGASQAFATSVPTGTGQLYNTANQIFGGNGVGRASEATIITTDTFHLAALTDAQDIITAQGYAPNNLVCVMQPPQFRTLLQDSNVNRLVSFGPNTTPGQSWLAQGVVPELVGFEIRRSTLGTTGTGSGSITTYNAWAYIKGLTPAMAASRDLMIETFRDIRVNSTWVKGHWDLKCNVLHPNSLVQIDTA